MFSLSSGLAAVLLVLFLDAALAQQPISGSADADSKPASPVWRHCSRVTDNRSCSRRHRKSHILHCEVGWFPERKGLALFAGDICEVLELFG